MHKYTATIDIPHFQNPEDLEHFIDGLRAYAHPKLVITAEATSKRELVQNVANELSSFWRGDTFTAAWWAERFKLTRRRKT